MEAILYNPTNSHVKIQSNQYCAIESVTWNRRTYSQSILGAAFLTFISWLVKNETFIITVEGRDFEVQTYFDGYVFHAVTSNYDGSGDHINTCHSAHGREQALAELSEQLREAILSDRI